MENSPAPAPSGVTLGKILFADDDEPFRLGLGKRLKRAGFECDYACSSSEAIGLLQTKEYDALLSDIFMPGNAGLELIASVAAVSEGLPIILLTGNPTMETATRSVRLRVMAYITKPPEFEELCNLLKAAVAERQNVRLLKENQKRLQNWEHEIEHILRMLQQAPPSDRQSTMLSYLRLTLRNLVVGLVDFEHLLVHEGKALGADQAVEHQQMLIAIRKTISVLQKTKEQFKNKELGDLRKELEILLG
jgi:DNA-binding response OmpR family regulator